ncbi:MULTISPECIES: DNA polymerase III subunit delta' [Tatumella]|uniref:DNA polymerase III subunit delta' n=1 Tax=Tatumella punctata TaxID=399969 RepID=A0ABW1VQ27_9GAMM|nr:MULTISPECIES: DNA polymerase III subunit delta' [unclassified Tatumella]MBS0856645.1 DNA polymerase III subunit delta' [Tatumella sp. JGM16]MBS0894567.1 DNA polymerase III subunit delta' [Tatumella sp. JGM130]MBS0912859.1 DNA polymerase III subunit delta' [Tatumella sp. JGM91]
MEWYPWLNSTYKNIISQHQAGRGHHALLIQALPGMGDSALVWGVSRWLMCSQPAGVKSCGQCHGCQLMTAHNHPDWYSLTAEKGKSSLGVDAIRQVTDKLYHFAQQGGAKVIYIPYAEQLTEAAANALLKTLEEPPADCWFFLCSRQPSALPATLRSRCMTLTLPVPAEQHSLQWLAAQTSQPQDNLLTALRLAGGAPAAALEMFTGNQWEQRSKLCQGLGTSLPDNCLALLPLLNHEDVALRIHWLMALLLDSVKYHQQNLRWITNIDQQPLVARLAEIISLPALHQSLSRWMQCRHHLLETPAVNHELLVTEALLDWEQMFRAG